MEIDEAGQEGGALLEGCHSEGFVFLAVIRSQEDCFEQKNDMTKSERSFWQRHKDIKKNKQTWFTWPEGWVLIHGLEGAFISSNGLWNKWVLCAQLRSFDLTLWVMGSLWRRAEMWSNLPKRKQKISTVCYVNVRFHLGFWNIENSLKTPSWPCQKPGWKFLDQMISYSPPALTV